MTLNDSLDERERAKLAVWDYPVSDKFTNMWSSMTSSGFPQNFEEAVARIKDPGDDEEFAFIGLHSLSLNFFIFLPNLQSYLAYIFR